MAKRKRDKSMVPVGGHGDMERVLGLTIIRRQTLDAAQDALVDALLDGSARMVAKQDECNARALVGLQALEAKVREGQVVT